LHHYTGRPYDLQRDVPNPLNQSRTRMDSMMAKRTRVSTGTPLEIKFRYSRAVRVGDLVFVSGTTAMKDGALVGVGDAGAQTRQILANILWALGQAGASANDVVRNRIYLTNIADWPAVVDEVSKAFAPAVPTSTLVEVKGLINPDMLVEIEVDAIVGASD
jgi:enamine deaminase RidA (YjgF/YER057c/UK114 family)